MIIDCISDLHGVYPKLDGGDLLILAGDYTTNDSEIQWDMFYEWLDVQPYRKKIVVAGNHDNNIDPDHIHCMHNCEYLQDSGTEFEGIKIWGTPWSLWFNGINPHCKAFTGSEDDLQKKYNLISWKTDILISHGPPYGILDKTNRGEHVGSKALRNLLFSSKSFPKLQYVIFGHIHECGGRKVDLTSATYINCSMMTADYNIVNPPMRIEL
jgi:Icc-related predicted phosphoesterase